MEGMPVSLKCVIDADPTSHAIWYKDEVPSIPSSPSFASSLSSSLSHRAGSSLEQDEEDEDDIKSALNRNEDERINNNLKGGRKTIPIALPSPGGIYTIESAKVSDTGWYRCSVDYEFGSFSSYSYYLHIRCKPLYYFPPLPVSTLFLLTFHPFLQSFRDLILSLTSLFVSISHVASHIDVTIFHFTDVQFPKLKNWVIPKYHLPVLLENLPSHQSMPPNLVPKWK